MAGRAQKTVANSNRRMIRASKLLPGEPAPGSSGELSHHLGREVRSLRHPLYGRPLVNRNPAQSNRAYVPGRDAFA